MSMLVKRKKPKQVIVELEPAIEKIMKFGLKYKRLQKLAKRYSINAYHQTKISLIRELLKKGWVYQKATILRSKVQKNTNGSIQVT